MCAAGGVVIDLANKKASIDANTSMGLHNDCWEKKEIANVGAIRLTTATKVIYDSTTQTFALTQEGCGDQYGYRLCVNNLATR